MGDIMLLGVLRMPFDTKGDLHLSQLQQRCVQAADRIEADTVRLSKAKEEIRKLKNDNAQMDYMLDAIAAIARGEKPDDFALSFSPVREVWDLKQSYHDLKEAAFCPL